MIFALMVVGDGSGDGDGAHGCDYYCCDGDGDKTYATRPSGVLAQLSAMHGDDDSDGDNDKTYAACSSRVL